MNIFNTPQIQAQGTGIAPASDAFGGLGNQVSLDPEAIKLLQKSSEENGVNFEAVLKASQNGQDPEAVIELLKKDKGSKDQKTATPVQSVELKNQALEGKQAELDKALNGEEAVVNERKSFFPSNKKLKSNEELLKAIQSKQSSVSEGSVDLKNTNELTQKSEIQQKTNLARNNKINQLNIAEAGTQQLNNNSKNLLDLNGFMAKQSPSLQANAAQKAYKPLSDSMFNQKVEDSLPGVIKKTGGETSLQDIILGNNETDSQAGKGLNSEQNNQVLKTGATVQAASAKVFDMSQLQGTNSTTEVISKVQDYLIQAKVGSQSEVQVTFEHKDLGKIDLLVQKSQADQLNVSIGARASEGLEFFTRNQGELLSTLAKSGLQIGEFKIETSSSNNNQSLAQDSGKQQSSQEGRGQHQSQSGQRDQDSKRREDLWSQFEQDKEVA